LANLEVQTYLLTPEVHGMGLQGEIDLHTCPKIREAINNLITDNHCNLVINLEQTRYIDSTGLVVLLHALKRVQEKQGRLALVCTDAHVLKIFTIAGLIDSFRICATEHEALDAVTAPAQA